MPTDFLIYDERLADALSDPAFSRRARSLELIFNSDQEVTEDIPQYCHVYKILLAA